MARARRVSNEEPNSTIKQERAGSTISGQVDEEELDADRILEQSASRILPREDLRSCTVCKRNDIKPEEFRGHVVKHKATYGGTPKGYYGCWSGQEFWLPLKFATGPCKWLCSVCGRPKYYFGKGNTHGGPTTRLADRRYALSYCEGARYPAHKRAFGKIDGAAGPVIFMHEGAPNPSQPEQTDPKVLEIVNAESVQPKAKRKTSSKRTTNSGRAHRAGTA